MNDLIDDPDDDRPDPAEPGDGRGLVHRRAVLGALAALGAGTATFRRAVAAQAEGAGKVTPEMIKQAEWIAGLDLTDEERASTARAVQRSLGSFEALRKVEVGYDVPPSLAFLPAPGMGSAEGVRRNRAEPAEWHAPKRPDSDEAIAFLPVTELSALVRARQVGSAELTRIYLDRLKRFDPLLKCVVTLTEDLALKQAARADAEIAAGIYRGPLHGIPWGAKDLIAYPGYPTSWGATPFKDRVIADKATVAARLEEAGAVLVAKLSMGALRRGTVGSAARPARRGTPGGGRAARRPGRRRRSPPGWSDSRSGARRSAASSRPAAPAAPRACGPRSAASADTAACPWRGRSTRSARSPARSRTVPWSSTPSTAPTASTRPPSTSPSPGLLASPCAA